jgi:hypothetical protein
MTEALYAHMNNKKRKKERKKEKRESRAVSVPETLRSPI